MRAERRGTPWGSAEPPVYAICRHACSIPRRATRHVPFAAERASRSATRRPVRTDRRERPRPTERTSPTDGRIRRSSLRRDAPSAHRDDDASTLSGKSISQVFAQTFPLAFPRRCRLMARGSVGSPAIDFFSFCSSRRSNRIAKIRAESIDAPARARARARARTPVCVCRIRRGRH